MGMGSATNEIKWRLVIVGSKKLGLSDLFRYVIYVPFMELVSPLFFCMRRMVGFIHWPKFGPTTLHFILFLNISKFSLIIKFNYFFN
jgi:hypothetical protein